MYLDMIKKNIKLGMGIAAGIGLSSVVLAQGNGPDQKLHIDWKQRYEAKTTLDPYDDKLLGDNIDPQTGALSFTIVDVSLPGNSELEVAIRRTLSQGGDRYNTFVNWELDYPVIYTKVFDTTSNGSEGLRWGSNRCSEGTGALPTFRYSANGFKYIYPFEYSGGIQMRIPGQGIQAILDASENGGWPAGIVRSTAKNWVITCLTNVDGNGTEGFLAKAPNGTTYRFDKVFRRLRTEYTETWGNTGQGPFDVDYTKRYMNLEMLAASVVTDVHGNTVTYSYNSNGSVTRIEANDGRRIDLHYETYIDLQGATRTKYEADRITVQPATPEEREWTYTYGADVVNVFYDNYHISNYRNESEFVLKRVTQPDGHYWEYALGGLSRKAIPGSSFLLSNINIQGPNTSDTQVCKQKPQTLTVKHPYGTVGTFSIEEQSLAVAPDVGPQYSASCPRTLNGEGSAVMSDTMVVKSKTLTGAGLPTGMTWQYEYYQPSTAGYGLDNFTDVTRPDGSVQRYVHYNPYQTGGGKLGGKLKTLETFADSNATTPLQKITYTYTEGESAGGHGIIGAPTSWRTPVHQTKMVLAQDGDTYTTETAFNVDRSSTTFSYGNPISVKRWSSATISSVPREEVTTYEHNLTHWVLGLPKTITQNGVQTKSYVYNPKGQVTQENRYGHLFATYGYNVSDGTVAWVDDAEQRRTRALNWYRGKPQEVQLADNTSFTQTVNDNGWVISATAPNAFKTDYSYDNMGRLTLIDPEGGWTNTVISYDFTGGGALQTITKGQATTTTTYDAMFRPILERRQALDTGWESYVNTAYDVMSRVAFKSQPSLSATETKGVETTYDKLGRLIQTRENVTPYATTQHSYYSNHRFRVTDPSGAYTEYFSYGYGGPSSKEYRQINKHASNGDTLQQTEFIKNIRGYLLEARQWGNGGGVTVEQSQLYYYDSRDRLCRHYAPEHGAMLYAYNEANELTMYAKGQGNTHCAQGPTLPASNANVTLTYDLVGQLTTTNFADPNTPDIMRGYDDNGNLTHVNRGSGANAVNWTYGYNPLNLLTSESLSIDGRSYSLAYQYNNDAHLTQKTLASGRQIQYNLDGLGRPLTVTNNGTQTLASSIDYHFSGVLEAMTYGNGHSFTQSFNDRLLPKRILSVGSSQTAIDQTLSYDARAKVTSILDGVVSSNSRTYTYDGMGRLKTAAGPWGNGSYEYDALDNLRQKTLGNRTVTLSYDANNRLAQSVDTGASGTRSLGYSDNRGNVTSLGDIGFTYDYSDQPVQVSGSSSGTYRYDGNMKRVKVNVDGKIIYNVFDASGTLVYIDEVQGGMSDIDVCFSECSTLSVAGSPRTTEYIALPNGSSARIINNNIVYLHSDYLGSGQSGTDANGNVVWRQQYTPFGEEVQTVSVNNDLAGFTGHIKDRATGLNYMQARYYDPVIGRFLSNDPVSFASGGTRYFNRYSYAHNDPVNKVDPAGMAPAFAHIHGIGYTIVFDSALANALISAGQSSGGTNNSNGASTSGNSGSAQKTPVDRAKAVLTTAPLGSGAKINTKSGATADGRFGPYRTKPDGSAKHHHGVDLAASSGDSVYAAGDGRVYVVKAIRGYGKVVYIMHSDGVITRSAHLKTQNVTLNQRVKAGDVIGTVGRTGNLPRGSQTHLHYEILVDWKRINPADVHGFTQ